MANPTGKGGFKKGDPRINRRGRPKTFDAFRELAQSISHEAATNKGEPLVIDGHVVTLAEAILRKWATSPDARLQIAFIEMAYGKPVQRSEVTGKDGGAIEQKVTITDDSILRKLLPELASDGTPNETKAAE
jgi:hypothetical protein